MASSLRDEVIHLRIPANPKYVCMVRRAVASIARSLGFPDKIVDDIELSVAEAVSNSVEHGSPSHGENIVAVVCRITDAHLTIDVRDEGNGFDIVRGSGDSDILNERGRGLRLIYDLMDNVRVCRTVKGSRIRMVKKIQSALPAEDAKVLK
ncbi:MAG: ATP-binding protein [Armatimonadota bacterium]